MKVIVFAYHEIGYIGLSCLIKLGFKVLSVITHIDDHASEKIFFSSVKKKSLKHKIPVFYPKNINNLKWIDYLSKLKPDIIFSFYYRKILSEDILKIPKLGSFNLHGSLLPKYRGCSPLNWVLINGEKTTGVTLHRMTKKIDHGSILSQYSIKIEEKDTSKSLYKKLCYASMYILNKTLPMILKNKINEIDCTDDFSSYFHKRYPKDGLIDWNQSANNIYNLIRALTKPWPGAFSYLFDKKIIIWKSKISFESYKTPGTILNFNPLIISCKKKSLEILSAQYTECNILNKRNIENISRIKGKKLIIKNIKSFKNLKKILILGVNGFIGYHITNLLLKYNNYKIYGIDIKNNLVKSFIGNEKFCFIKGDIKQYYNWVKKKIKKCDIILPLIAIARPMQYIKNPLKVFKIDFEENLKIIRYCVKYKKRIIFPSTSEVYGMCKDDYFDEENSNLVTGAIKNQRWIYSSSKQLLDRIIWAYGVKNNLNFTIFRPFNWIGPGLDDFKIAEKQNARVTTQIIFNLINGLPVTIVNNGNQKRCFTDIDDGIEALFEIIKNKNNKCNKKIINIGNPHNEYTIMQLTKIIINIIYSNNRNYNFPKFSGFNMLSGTNYYGEGYQDIDRRKPNIDIAKKLLNWTPKTKIRITLRKIINFFINNNTS
ncbi:b2255 [Wigglesworthia glossinidia endosymbiont of Glossina brevipalpis]|uniref:Bifunctional polymyxin resistance protein ArnA n=1 Tax=Wigglesworthia glossinidia brevipalpis TaxID=36870 RepID=ARNA_WIGBR|nr:RecName: Full=Bifunctional polymyxin resistance protein ArnA; Includes: RecName: Full=UDP-4-amino-4-deoxy-L-arabinose formyltransferase; AltName: Full=ArnAFT; AltName: Full=UDP-L-Ara4N formyltransferase; Includes: RecName: Full=UDP-glucuronic acid oxidase, UDP-4-keto-hexauronic acid decarboxylating; AltName: Full=ArnADH; AltName: Full=UDP-GlcUA decarboxylase; AltName: Full=UDP-glucuronic acid dehydrogenase [Wigglesworthia glossinidia endosymbiont of Glossina brevipalpis]BAC24306.1 b2255 [Wiggle